VKVGRKPKSITKELTRECVRKLQKRHERAAAVKENYLFRKLSIQEQEHTLKVLKTRIESDLESERMREALLALGAANKYTYDISYLPLLQEERGIAFQF
jgi:hypothetical protein